MGFVIYLMLLSNIEYKLDFYNYQFIGIGKCIMGIQKRKLFVLIKGLRGVCLEEMSFIG